MPEKLIYCDVDKPIPNENEVLVKVHAVSLNAADYRSMNSGLIIPKNKIFGADISGHVETVGKNTTLFNSGDEVVGDLARFGFGGLAEYVAVSEKALVAKPYGVSFEDAAALPMAGLTALLALREKGNIKKGNKTLIVGGAGGVGTFAVQLAKYFQTEVTAVCSSKHIEQTLSLGADHVIDYTKENIFTKHNHYNLILGINGNYPLLSYKKALAPGGIFVMVGGDLSQILKSIFFGGLLSLGSKKMRFLYAKENSKDLEFLLKLLEEKKIKPFIEKTYLLDKAIDAIKFLSRGHSSGKIVITL